MRTTTITSTQTCTKVEIVASDLSTSLVMPHDIIPQALAVQIATSLAQVPDSYEGCSHKE